MDYQLFPIRKSDLDKSVYLLVKAAVLTHSVEVLSAYYPEFPGEEALGLKRLFFDHADQRCYLVFPSQHRQFRLFPSEVTRQEALIAVYDKTGRDLAGYYTLDGSDAVDVLQYRLSWHKWQSSDVPPVVFPNSAYELLLAILRVTQILESRTMTSCEWYKRLVSARHILECGGDKMHILHNGGLYDYASLRQFVQESGLSRPQAGEALDELASQLRQYAMYAVSISRLIDRRADYIYRKA